MNLVRTAAPIVCALAALIACNRDRDRDRDRDRTRSDRTRPQTTAISSANPATMTNTVALNRIADARCAREAACNNVGNDKHYATTEACTRRIRDDIKDDLNEKDCPAGVSTKQLDACLASIKAENCSNVLDHIERLMACRKSELCAPEKRTSS